MKASTDVFIIFLLITVTLLLTINTLISYGPAMYNIDPYTYLSSAIAVNEGSAKTINPFILLLAGLIKLLGFAQDKLFLLRLINICFAVQLVVFVYLISRKIFNHFIATCTAVLTASLPLVQSYAITLHNDIFGIAMAVTSMYFLSEIKLRSMLLGLAFFVISSLTRPDLALIVFLPLLISIWQFLKQKMKMKSDRVTSVMIILIFIGGAYILLRDYYSSTTRFNLIEKIILFLRWDILEVVIRNIIKITGITILDNIYTLVIILGVSILICTRGKTILQTLAHSFSYLSQSQLVAINITVAFSVSVFSLALFHVNYTIVDDKVIIDLRIPDRYFILSQVLLLFGFTYTLSHCSLNNLKILIFNLRMKADGLKKRLNV